MIDDTQSATPASAGFSRRYCTQCGASHLNDARFCTDCGTPVSALSVNRLEPEGGPASVPEPSDAALVAHRDMLEPLSADRPPATIRPESEPEHAPVDNTVAWILAFAPLIMILLSIIFALNGVGVGVGLSALVAIAANIALAEVDSRRVGRAGFQISSVKAAVLVPAYLFTRASVLKQNFAIPIVWCACAVLSLGGSGLVSSIAGVSIDSGAVEVQVAKGILDQTGVSANVQCPNGIAVRPGSSFKCTASAGGQMVFVEVTVQNADGDILWEVRN